MRIQLNLNQYYEGIDLPNVNEIFSSFINMKTYVDQYHYLKGNQNKDEIWEKLWEICKKKIMRDASKINELMDRLGKEKIFDIKDIDDTDFEAVVLKYEYLMSKPEIDKDGEKKIEAKITEGREPSDD